MYFVVPIKGPSKPGWLRKTEIDNTLDQCFSTASYVINHWTAQHHFALAYLKGNSTFSSMIHYHKQIAFFKAFERKNASKSLSTHFICNGCTDLHWCTWEKRRERVCVCVCVCVWERERGEREREREERVFLTIGSNVLHTIMRMRGRGLF